MATTTNHDIKFESAIEELSRTPIWRSNYLPPITRLLRAFGFAVRPPHYYSFASNTLSCAAWFSTFWGLAMWFLAWSDMRTPLPQALIVALLTGCLFGLMMAWYYSFSRRMHNLSTWDSLPVPAPSPIIGSRQR